jgi:hypothetical protein
MIFKKAKKSEKIMTTSLHHTGFRFHVLIGIFMKTIIFKNYHLNIFSDFQDPLIMTTLENHVLESRL